MFPIGKVWKPPLFNLDFSNIAHAFSEGPQGESLIGEKLYLKENSFIAFTETDITLIRVPIRP